MKGEEKKVGVSGEASRISLAGLEQRRYFSQRWFVALGVLMVLILGVWMLFFSYADCETWECFNDHLRDCDKAKFIGETNMVFEYIIEGSSNGECEVVVYLLRGELDNQDSIKLEMQRMTCMLPEGVVMVPESDIGNCHGMLKEGLQELVIKKLHSYLVQNLGRVNLEILDAPELEEVVGG